MVAESTTPASMTDQRRSRRVLAQLPVTVIARLTGDNPCAEDTRAEIVNAHGGLVTLAITLRRGAKVILRNPATGRVQAGRVTYLGEKQAGRVEIGIGFREPAPEFWGIKTLPEDW